MRDVLLLKNPEAIKLADVHRLPQHPGFNTAGGKVTRPIIIKLTNSNDKHQRWSRGHKARGQGQGHKNNPRPRTTFPRTDTLEAKDRNARGQGQGPRTQAQVLSKKRSAQKFFRRSPKKKKSSQKFFKRSPRKNVF